MTRCYHKKYVGLFGKTVATLLAVVLLTTPCYATGASLPEASNNAAIAPTDSASLALDKAVDDNTLSVSSKAGFTRESKNRDPNDPAKGFSTDKRSPGPVHRRGGGNGTSGPISFHLYELPGPTTDAAIMKEVNNKTPLVGSVVTFTLTLTNEGTVDMSEVVVEGLCFSIRG